MQKRNRFFITALLVVLCHGIANGQSTTALSATSTVCPYALALDSHCNLYYGADAFATLFRYGVVKVDAITGAQSTFAGSTTSHGFSGNGGPATSALTGQITSLAFDNAGNLFMSDFDNGVIWMVDGSGNIHIVAGTGTPGYRSADNGGPATAAEINGTMSIAVDNSGNLYIIDEGENIVRVVSHASSLSGSISTFAGTPGTPGYTGDGSAATGAKLNNPALLACDADGNVYICDYSNNVIRQVSSGVINTFAGRTSLGISITSSTHITPTSANLSGVSGMVVDEVNNILYFGTTDGNCKYHAICVCIGRYGHYLQY